MSVCGGSDESSNYLYDALGQTSTLRYDLSGPDYNASGSQGQLSELQDPAVTTRYQRDALGRITQKVQLLNAGSPQTVHYSYTPAGQLATQTYPSSAQLGYSYSSTGQLSSLTWNGLPLVSNLTWNPLGQPTAWQWSFAATPIQAQRTYNTAGQLSSSEIAHYTLNAAGRITSLGQNLMVPSGSANASTVAALDTTSTIVYDAVGRITSFKTVAATASSMLASVTLGDITGAAQTSYSYDANGNRTYRTQQQTTSTGATVSLERHYTLDPQSNQQLGYKDFKNSTQTASRSYAYNAAGHITNTGGQELLYNAAGRLAQALPTGQPENTTSYHYNALGQRVNKTTTSTSQSAVYGEDDYGQGSLPLGLYGTTTTPDSTEVIYLPTANGPMPIAAVINGQIYAVHSDHLNTPRRLTQADGQVAWQWPYSAFGEVPPSTGKTRFISEKLHPPIIASAAGVRFDLRYPGQVADEETGLFYNHYRSYDPEQGRYVQADPIGLEGGWNRYAYVEGNPLSYIDPQGLQVIQQGVRSYIGPNIHHSYDPNDVRGGFDQYGNSLVYHPAHYNPGAASELLIMMVFGFATGPTSSICTTPSLAREAIKSEVFAVRAAPELRSIFGWGIGLDGVRKARIGLDAAALARIQSSMSRVEVEAVKNLYNAAATAGRGGLVAHERAAYMVEILKYIK